MYVLGIFDIDSWLYKICISLYSLAADVYKFIIQVAGNEIMESDAIREYAGNISILVGVFMLFKVAISLLSYLVDPDAMDDKNAGSSKLITGIVVTMVMLIAYPFAFSAMRTIQQAILNPSNGDNILVRLFSGSGDGETEGEEYKEYIDGLICNYKGGHIVNWGGATDAFDFTIAFQKNSAGGQIYGSKISKTIVGVSFDKAKTKLTRYNKKGEEIVEKWWKFNRIAYDVHNYSTGIEEKADDMSELKSCPQYVSLSAPMAEYESIYILTLNDNGDTNSASYSGGQQNSYTNDAGRRLAGSLLFSFTECYGNECTKFKNAVKRNDISGAYDFIIDKDGKLTSGVEFKSILALMFGVVLLLFLIVTIADVAVRSIKLIVLEIFAPIPIIAYSDPKTRNTFESWIKTVGVTYVDIFIRIIIIAVCNFLIANVNIIGSGDLAVNIAFIIGILLFMKEAPQFICNMLGIKAQGLGNFTLNPMQKLRETPLIGGAMGAASGAVGGAVSGARTGGWAGGIMGAFAGGHAGFRNSGGLAGQQHGKQPQNSSGRVGSAAGEAFMKGKGGFMSQQVGATAARAYIGNAKYSADEKKARADLATAAQNRSNAQSDLDTARTNYASAKAAYEVNPTSPWAHNSFMTASSDLINAQTAYNAARQAEETAQATLAEAERVRGKAKSVVDDAPPTARQVRHP